MIIFFVLCLILFFFVIFTVINQFLKCFFIKFHNLLLFLNFCIQIRLFFNITSFQIEWTMHHNKHVSHTIMLNYQKRWWAIHYFIKQFYYYPIHFWIINITCLYLLFWFCFCVNLLFLIFLDLIFFYIKTHRQFLFFNLCRNLIECGLLIF